jgi:MFS family permease
MTSPQAPRGLLRRGRGHEQYWQVLLLATAQALFQTASTLVVTIGALAGAQVAPGSRLSTAPVAAMFLGTVVTTVPASQWMLRVGRRTGYIVGALLGTLGGMIGAWGVHSGSLLVLSLGTMLIGAYQGFAQTYRFAASEVAGVAFRPRAISLVLAGGVVAAVLGPALATWGGPLLEPAYVGSFVILSAITLTAAGLLAGLRVPAPDTDVSHGTRRPLLAIMRQPTYAVALFAAATGSGVMVLAMTATPLAMAHHSHSLSDSAMVIQAHVLGMFLPSFFTGSLIARFGVLRVMLAGAALLAGHVLSSLTGTGLISFASALVLLGVGWNFLYVGGTTLLTSTYLPTERSNAQAANDLSVFLVGLAASLSAGALLQTLGWRLMNVTLLPWLFTAVVALLWMGTARRTPGEGAGGSGAAP